MSYHSILGAVSFSASATSTMPTCAGGVKATWSKTGWVCPKPSGSTVTPTTKPQAKDTVIPTTTATATTATPTPEAVKYGTLLWSATHEIATPTTTYTKAPTKAPDYESDAASAQASATQKVGMNWLPWALGAAGVIGVVWLARRRA